MDTETIELLELLRERNPWWFSAMLECVGVMLVRLQKYAPDDPFDNFRDVSEMTGLSVEDVLRMLVALKMARLKRSKGDFPDETLHDTLVDLANYAMILLAWTKRK